MIDFKKVAFCDNSNCGIKDRWGHRHRHLEDGLIQFIWISPDIRSDTDKIKITSFKSDDEVSDE